MGHSFAYLFERFPSFVQTFCYREVQEMVRQGMEPLILSIRQPEDSAELAATFDFPITYLPPEKELRAEVDRSVKEGGVPRSVRRQLQEHRSEPDSQRLFEAVALSSRLREAGVSHIHAHFGGMAARTAWWLRELYGFTYSFTGHANDIFCEHQVPVTNAMLVRDARLVVTETDYARRWMEVRHPRAKGKIVRVYNGITLPERAVDYPTLPALPRILSVGRFVEKKGFADLIDACALLRERQLEFECFIVGGGPLHQELQSRIDRLELAGQVRLLGPKPQTAVAALLRSAHLFILPCVPEQGGGSDNLPTVVAEAMAAGVPTICTPIAGVPEMITSEVDGLLVPAANFRMVAEAAERLLRDRALAQRLGEAGRAKVERQFAVSTVVAELKHLLVQRCPVQPTEKAQDLDETFPPVGGWLQRLLGRS